MILSPLSSAASPMWSPEYLLTVKFIIFIISFLESKASMAEIESPGMKPAHMRILLIIMVSKLFFASPV